MKSIAFIISLISIISFANFSSNESQEFTLKFTGTIEIPTQEKLQIKDLIDEQLLYLSAPLGIGYGLEEKPLTGFQSAPHPTYQVSQITELQSNTEISIFSYSYSGKIQIEKNASLNALDVVLPLNPTVIYKTGTIRKRRRNYNPCSDYQLESIFFVAWRPWRPGCQLTVDVDYIKIKPQLTKINSKQGLTFSTTQKPKVFFMIYDDVIGRRDTGDLTFDRLQSKLSKISQSRSKNMRQWLGSKYKRLAFSYFTSAHADYFLVKGSLESKSFFQVMNKAFNEGDIVYHLGHSAVLNKMEYSSGIKPRFSSKKQLFVVDSCSSYYFDMLRFRNLKPSGQMDFISNGVITKGYNNKAELIIDQLESYQEIRYDQFFSNLTSQFGKDEMASLSRTK